MGRVFERTCLLLGLLSLGLSACEQRPGIAPRVDSVTPSEVAVGQERFVVLHGRFGPQVTWTPGQEPSLRAEFQVTFGDQPSDMVRLDSSERLVARVPAIAQAGCVDVTVSGPGGTSDRLEGGLCLREVETLALMLGCYAGDVLGLCSYDDADGSFAVVHTDILWATTPTIHAGFFDAYRVAYVFSPDGRHLLFLREVLDHPDLGDDSWRDRQVILRDMDDGWELILAESRQPPPEGPESQWGYESFAELAFSPDGTRIAYVEKLARLVVRQVPESAQVVPPPVVVVDWTDQPGTRVGNPDFDIATTQVLFCRSRDGAQDNPLENETDLFLAPLDGSHPPVDLFPDAPDNQVNGPGSFDPAGGSVVFVSSRVNMQVASPYLIMLPVTNLFRLKLSNGRVEPLTVPTAGVYSGAPQMSPDGRLVANTGFIDEVAGRTLDVLVTDLAAGRTVRLGPDRGPFCYPQGLESCVADTLFGCCYYGEGGAVECCDIDHPEQCPTFDLLPAFAPDSQALVANYAPWMWWCFADGSGAPDWTLGFIQFGLFLGLRDPDVPGLWHEMAVPTDELGLGFGAIAPVFRQTLVSE